MADKDLGRGRSCFIVGPIGDRLEPAGTPGKMAYENATQMWENVFEPACEVFGLAPVRADKISEAGDIPEQIFTYLRDADIVIADVTGGNANVMYELGLRHTRDKITIQIGEHERLPFDVTTIRTIKFRRTEAGLIDARNALVEALRVALEGGGSPVTATRVWNDVTTIAPDDVARASALSFESDDPADQIAEDAAPGRLELMVQGEEAIEALGGILENFGDQMTAMSNIGEEHTPAMGEAENFASRLTVMKKFAEALAIPANEMSETSSEYLTRVEQVDTLMRFLATDLESNPEQADEAEDFMRSLQEMSTAAEEASVMFTDLVGTVRDMRGWSTLVRPVAKSLEHSLNTMLRGNAMVVAWRGLLDEALATGAAG